MLRLITSDGDLMEVDCTPEEELALIAGEPFAVRGRVRVYRGRDADVRLARQLGAVRAHMRLIEAEHGFSRPDLDDAA